MAIREWMAIVRMDKRSLFECEKKMMEYHGRNNHRFHTHFLSHTGLLYCAVRNRNIKKIATQGWLTVAVLPVHTKNFGRDVIRGVVRNLS